MSQSGKPKIVILGAGFAGLTLATRLDDVAAEGLAEVTLVESNVSMVVGGLLQYLVKDEIRTEDVAMYYDDGRALRCENVNFVSDEVHRIDTDSKTLYTRAGEIAYDYLAIAAGARYVPELMPGLAESAYNMCSMADALQLKSALKRFDGGRIVVSITELPYKCPAVPQEYALVIETMLREAGNGLRERTEIVFTTEADSLFPMTKYFTDRFEEFDIKLMVFAPVKEVDPEEKVITFGVGREGDTHEPLSYDLMVATYPLAAPAGLASLCDETRLIPSHPRSMETQWDGVWALGDGAAMKLASGPYHPKAGTFAVTQAHALADNLESIIRTGELPDSPSENLGLGACEIEVGNNEATKISVNLMGGETSSFEMSPVSEQAVIDKLIWISDSMYAWFKERPAFTPK